MKIAVYSPYLDTLGGGERYMLTIAETLSAKASVDLLFDEHLYSLGAEKLKSDLSRRFDLDLSKVSICKAPLGKDSNSYKRFFFLQKYDVLFYLTDGSIFYPSARKNILHLQSPLKGQTESLWGRFKLNGWDLIIYNSEFTRLHSQNNWPIYSQVVYPPVDTDKIKPLKKKKYILSVGRFFGYLKDKKQEVLIRTFKNLYENDLKDWSLHLVGSAGEGDKNYLSELKSSSLGLPVKFYPNLNYDQLVNLYGQSMIYWHAAGFEEEDPTKMEHFGISTVEAMAGGCVPVVINRGGQTEIVDHGKSGYLWNNLEEMKEFTIKLIEEDYLREKMGKAASKRSQDFSKDKFEEKIRQVVK